MTASTISLSALKLKYRAVLLAAMNSDHHPFRFATPWLVVAATIPFSVTVIAAVVSSLLSIVGEGHPFFGDTSGVELDAHAVGRGEPLYRDPADGYTPLLYTPLLPVLGAALDQVHFWSGWTVVVTLVSGLALAGFAATVVWRAWPPPRPRPLVVPAAVGVAALGWWLIACIPFSFLYAPRPDQLSWALALGGLLLVPGAVQGSRRSAVAMVLLLSASLWTKQTGIAAVAAALVALGWFGLHGRVSWGRVAAVALAMAAVNALVLALLMLGTGGWAYDFTVGLPREAARVNSLHLGLERAGTALLLPAALAAVVWGGVGLQRHGLPLPRREPEGDRLVVLSAFVVTGSVFALVFHAKQGTAYNQFIGVAWALVLIAACGWGRAAQKRGSAVAVALAVVGLFGLASSEGLRTAAGDALSLAVAGPGPRAFVAEVPEALRDAESTGSVFHPVHSGLGFERGAEGFPTVNNVQDLFAGGQRPQRLIRALLERRFAIAYLYERTPEREEYTSGYGAHEDNVLWKLNEVIRAGYEGVPDASPDLIAAQSVPSGITPYRAVGPLRRRSGGSRPPWLGGCFAPFTSPAGPWEIGRGGGFWCRRGRSQVRLLRTPASRSELRLADADGQPRGTLVVEISGFSRLTVRAGGSTVEVSPTAAQVYTGAAPTQVSLGPAPRRRLELSLGGPGRRATASADSRRLRVSLPRGRAGGVSVLADARSDALVDMRLLGN